MLYVLPWQPEMFTCLFRSTCEFRYTQKPQDKTTIIALALNLELLKSIPLRFQHNLMILKILSKISLICAGGSLSPMDQ